MSRTLVKTVLAAGLVASASALSATPACAMPAIDRGVAIAARPTTNLETVEQARWVCDPSRCVWRRPFWRRYRYYYPYHYYYGYGWPWYRWPMVGNNRQDKVAWAR